MSLLAQCGNLLFLGAVPFSTYASSYNRRFNYNKQPTTDTGDAKVKRKKRDTAADLEQLLLQRIRLDRRRLEEGFLLYASLEILNKYNLWTQIGTFPCNRNELVEIVTKEFSPAFLKKWGDHVCESPGCKSTLVLDGNMKNARQVCMVKDVAQLHFPGMPGAVVVGCQNTPAKGSRYCSQHCGTAMTFRDDMENVLELQGVPRIDEHGLLITKILNEKKTRQGIIYEAQWADGRKSWVKECNLPTKIQQYLKDDTHYNYKQEMVLIHEFGQKRTELKESSAQTNNIYTVSIKSSGFALDNDDSEAGSIVSCTTEKGRHKCKNHRTAGILAIAKPCGVVVDLKELFGAESKSQVYAHLHELLAKKEMSVIEFICYDDACHLKKYAQNSVRRNITRTAEKMAEMEMIVDRFHFKNHVDRWCKEHCNPYNCNDLKDVNTEVCEQLFSWLSKFAPITKHMNRWRFLFLMLYLLDNHNHDVERGGSWSC